jgi:succinyl-diaminopimelate desuccinylase
MGIVGPADLTRWLIKRNTTTAQIDPTFVQDFAALLSKLGFDLHIVEANAVQHLAATIGPQSAALRVAFVGHYDTVPVGDGWTHAPFEAIEQAGMLFGRGASDMKSGDAASIFAAIRLSEKGVRSTVFLPGDEETRSLGMPALLESLNRRFDYCICAEPTSKIKLGDCMKFGRRGVMRGAIALQGEAGHAAYASITSNIINKLPAVISELAKPWDDARHGSDTTLSITNITTNSTASNVIPSTVQLTFDCRFAPHRSGEEIEREVQKRLATSGVTCEITVAKVTRPYVTDVCAGLSTPQGRLVACAQQAIREVLQMEPALTCDGGTSDARFIAWQGVPTIEFGVPHGNMHGADEFVDVQNIEQLTHVYQRIVELLMAYH